MELKLRIFSVALTATLCSNRTFMELKLQVNEIASLVSR